MRVTIWLLIYLLPILKVVKGECNSPYLIFDEEYNLADPPVKGIEKNEIKLEKYIHMIMSGLRPKVCFKKSGTACSSDNYCGLCQFF